MLVLCSQQKLEIISALSPEGVGVQEMDTPPKNPLSIPAVAARRKMVPHVGRERVAVMKEKTILT
jgi:hypothetical protein